MLATWRQTWWRRYRHIRIVIINTWLAWRLNRRYQYPARSMRVVGITGTDGKTTTAHLLAAILQADGRTVGVISTLGATINGQLTPTGLHVSTPGPKELFPLLDTMRQAGVTDLILEVTSHGLDQRRIAGIAVDVAVMTNISPEHLDYHGTFDRYVKAKSRLLSLAKMSVLNIDDQTVVALRSRAQSVIPYGFSSEAEVRAEDWHEVSRKFTLVTPEDHVDVELQLPGRYNVQNSLAAAAVARHLKINLATISAGLQSVSGVAGRWEVLQATPFTVIVDFAHTPQSFAQVLPAARLMVQASGRLIHVFGCAADRDEAKRMEMGRLSGQLADVTILTMEDPRFESLDRIQSMIASGLQQSAKQPPMWSRVDDRGQAIHQAIDQARAGDVVLITGKGHETSLAIQGQELPWSDQAHVRQLLHLHST